MSQSSASSFNDDCRSGLADPARQGRRLRIYTLADVIVVASLLLAPLFTENLGFLRILRGLRLIHAYHLLRDLMRVPIAV